MWDADGNASAWSTPKRWEMGLLNEAAWGGAKWIAAPDGAYSFTDFRADFTLRVVRAAGGVFLRTDGTGRNAYMWNLTQAGTTPVIRAHKVVNNTYTVLKEIPQPGLDIFANHTLSVELEGSTIRTYLDGTLVDTLTDTTYDRGSIGLREQGSGESAVFDRITVKALDGKTLLDDDFSQNTGRWSAGTISGGTLTLGNALSFPSDNIKAPLFRRELQLTKPVTRARAYVSGLGIYEMSINGKRVGDRVLEPASTDYTKRVLYSTYDVTGLLTEGVNAVGVSVGPGWFGGLAALYGANGLWDGLARTRVKLVVDHPDGSSSTLLSDPSWKVGRGATLVGAATDKGVAETYDARLAIPGWNAAGFDDSAWKNAVVDARPVPLESQRHEPIRITAEMKAVKITNPSAGRWVFDFGKNIAGLARLSAQGAAGTQVTLGYGEKLNADGSVAAPGGRAQTNTYILRGGDRETWQTTFSYSGFQYVQIDGYPGTPQVDDLIALRIHTDVPATGNFASSDAMLNWLHDATASTTINNHVGILTDGSGLEKLPWTGDAGVMEDSVFRNFDMQRFYTQWMTDIRDSQDASGNIGSWAPQPPNNYRNPSAIWSHQYLATAENLYRYYGDENVIPEYYDSMAKITAYEVGRLTAQKISREAWGDWVTPATPNGQNEKNLYGTAYVIRSVDLMRQFAELLGKTSDVATYAALAEQLKTAFNANYLDRAAGVYRATAGANYLQTPNVIALAFGWVPEADKPAVLANLIRDVEVTRNGHLNTGVVGTKYLLRVLTENGRADLAYRVATVRTAPGWGAWYAAGATSLWEEWPLTSRSRGHWFLGTSDDWLYGDLAGIELTAPGYAAVRFKPYLPSGLDSAQASLETVRGTVASRWTRDSIGRVDLDVTVPATSTGVVYVPTRSPDLVAESGVPAANAPGVTYTGYEDGYAIYRVGSGQYHFRSGEAVANGGAGGTVPATLALSLSGAASFGAFTPGVAKEYTTSVAATVISTAGEASLTVSDPSPVATGHLVNGSFSLPSPVQVNGTSLPALAKRYTAPVSNDVATIGFSQRIAANDALRSGSYAKTLTFTLSTTTP